jgi:hypothetical protein
MVTTPEEDVALRMKAIEYLEAALVIAEQIGEPTSGYLIERALDQMRAETWPDAIDDAPPSH